MCLGHKQLKGIGLSEDVLAQIRDETETMMERQTEQIAQELLAESRPQLEEGRANELEIALRLSLNGIANRIDRRYHIEVRVGELPESPEGEEEGETETVALSDEQREHIQTVLGYRDTMKFMKLEGPPILSLPEVTSEEEETDTSE